MMVWASTQNAHEVEVRPSLMLRLRRADLFFENGLELDAWSDVAVQGANNPKIVRGAPGRVDVSHGVQVLEVPSARVDRSMGDVHPLGNPHYSLDPGLAPIVTQNIVDGLVRVAPELRAIFEKNREAFLVRLEEAMVRWTKTLEPVRGAKVVVYHPDYIYFLTRFGIVQAGMVEDQFLRKSMDRCVHQPNSFAAPPDTHDPQPARARRIDHGLRRVVIGRDHRGAAGHHQIAKQPQLCVEVMRDIGVVIHVIAR